MNPYMHAELSQIASHGRNLQLFQALDKLASGGVPLEADTPGQAPAKSQDGQVLCGKCSSAVEDPKNFCPKCGARIKRSLRHESAAPISSNDSDSESEDTQDESARGELSGAKVAGANPLKWIFGERSKSVIEKLPTAVQTPAAVGVLGGGVYVGNEGRKLLNGQKTASVRGGNPVLRIRRSGWKSMMPSKALEHLSKQGKPVA